MSATDVIDDVSRATLRICSIGTLLTRRIDRTARRVAMATPGRIRRSGIVAYAAAGIIPISAVPSRKAAAQPEGSV